MLSRKKIGIGSWIMGGVFWVESVWANSLPVMIVPPLANDSNQQASEAIRSAFRKTRRVSVVDASMIFNYLEKQQPSLSSQPANTEAAEALTLGQKAYREFQWKEAIESLQKAKNLYRKEWFRDDAFEGLRASQFYLAMTYLSTQEENRAKEELKEVIRLDPQRKKRKLSEKLYPPPIRKLHETLREEIFQQPLGELEIIVNASNALIYVDGETVGSPPLLLRELPVGEHFIQVQKKGMESYFEPKFVVAGPNRMVVELKNVGEVDPLTYFEPVQKASEMDPHRISFLDEMGLALGADLFVLLRPDYAKVQGQLFDQRSQEVSPLEVDSTPEGLVRKLLVYLDSSGYVTSSAGPNLEPKPIEKAFSDSAPSELQPTFSDKTHSKSSKDVPSSSSIWKQNRWIWIGVGGALVLIGGIFLGSSLLSQDPSTSHLTVMIPEKQK